MEDRPEELTGDRERDSVNRKCKRFRKPSWRQVKVEWKKNHLNQTPWQHLIRDAKRDQGNLPVRWLGQATLRMAHELVKHTLKVDCIPTGWSSSFSGHFRMLFTSNNFTTSLAEVGSKNQDLTYCVREIFVL